MTYAHLRNRRSPARAFMVRAGLGLLLLGTCTAGRAQPTLADSSTWEAVGSPLQISGFAFSGDPEAPLIWADGPGLWSIRDIAESWTKVHSGPSHGFVLLYGPDLSAPDTIFAGEGIYRSTNGGKSFLRLESPNDIGGSPAVDGPGIDRVPPGLPFSGRFIAADGLSFLLSDDGGDTWVAADTTPPLLAFSIKALQSGRILAAGFYGTVRSDDGGHTWHHIPDLYDPARIRFDAQKITVLSGFVTGQPNDSVEGRVVLTGTQGGADGGWFQWWSDDEGETWTRSLQPGNAGCGEGVDILPLVSETGQPGDAVAVTCLGEVLISNDGAETWEEIGQVPGISAEAMTNVETAALGPDGRIYVGTRYAGPRDILSYRTKWRASAGFAVSEVERPASSASRLTVRPNPSRQLVTLELAGENRQPVEVIVADVQGRELARHEMAPGSSWRLDVSGWAPGVYHARAGDGRQLETVSFTVVR